MKTEVTVQPAPGLQIRDPDLKDLLPEEGRTVPWTDYWQRRLRDHDVFEVAPKPPAAAVDDTEASLTPATPAE